MTNKDKVFLAFLDGWMNGIAYSVEPNPRQEDLLAILFSTFRDCVENNYRDNFLIYLEGLRRMVPVVPQLEEDNFDEILKDVRAKFRRLYSKEHKN